MRMNVAFPADGRGIAEARGNRFNGFAQVALGGGLRIESLEFIERHGGQHRAGPCAEILGGDVLS